MKIRHELNKCLYAQKMEGYERKPYYAAPNEFDAITCGDTTRLKALFSSGMLKLSTEKRTLSENLLKNMKYHFVIAATAIAVACLDSGLGHDESYMISDIYSQKADKMRTYDDLQMLFEKMCFDYAERIQEVRKDKIISLHIRKCINYIYEDFNADLSIRGLAGLTGLNESYLAKLFKKETGQTVKNYVTAAKMDTAQNLLKYSDLSIAMIATSLGYSSQSAFTYAFRKFTGMTPKKYREINYVVKFCF